MPVEHLRDPGVLVGTVVELEHDRIGLSAVDARALEEVLERTALVLAVDLADPGADATSTVLEVVGVEPLGSGDVAARAPTLEPIPRVPLEVEVGEELCLTAC
jgi:hypothetical protein